MKNLSYIFLLFLFFSCQKDEKHKYPRVILLDKKEIFNVNTNEMLNVENFPLLGFNFTKDTTYKIDDLYTRKSKKEKYLYCFTNPDTILPRYNLKVIIDTSYTIFNNHFQYNRVAFPDKNDCIKDGLINGKIPTKEDEERSRKIIQEYIDKKYKNFENYVRCLPLLVYNNSKDTVISKLKFLQEAKDIDGKWKPIEFSLYYEMCGNPERICYKVLPKNYVMAPIIKYSGNFKTKLRVKVVNRGNTYYSNEFYGRINRGQFKLNHLKEAFKYYYPDEKIEGRDEFYFLK